MDFHEDSAAYFALKGGPHFWLCVAIYSNQNGHLSSTLDVILLLNLTVQSGSNFWRCGRSPRSSLTIQFFFFVIIIFNLILLCKSILAFATVHEILKWNHSF